MKLATIKEMAGVVGKPVNGPMGVVKRERDESEIARRLLTCDCDRGVMNVTSACSVDEQTPNRKTCCDILPFPADGSGTHFLSSARLVDNQTGCGEHSRQLFQFHDKNFRRLPSVGGDQMSRQDLDISDVDKVVSQVFVGDVDTTQVLEDCNNKPWSGACALLNVSSSRIEVQRESEENLLTDKHVHLKPVEECALLNSTCSNDCVSVNQNCGRDAVISKDEFPVCDGNECCPGRLDMSVMSGGKDCCRRAKPLEEIVRGKLSCDRMYDEYEKVSVRGNKGHASQNQIACVEEKTVACENCCQNILHADDNVLCIDLPLTNFGFYSGEVVIMF